AQRQAEVKPEPAEEAPSPELSTREPEPDHEPEPEHRPERVAEAAAEAAAAPGTTPEPATEPAPPEEMRPAARLVDPLPEQPPRLWRAPRADSAYLAVIRVVGVGGAGLNA